MDFQDPKSPSSDETVPRMVRMSALEPVLSAFDALKRAFSGKAKTEKGHREEAARDETSKSETEKVRDLRCEHFFWGVEEEVHNEKNPRNS